MFEDMATMTFEVLSDPTRRRILERLRDGGEQPVGELVTALQLTQPAVSKHLRTLKDHGFVAVRPDAQRRLYRLRREPLLELDAWLEPFRGFWTERLDALEAHLDVMED
jgi:DNA-binding transcriptional ArsR family regulator